MLYSVNSIFLFLFIGVLINETSFTIAATIPSRNSEPIAQRQVNGVVVNVDGLDVLRTYVCPSHADPVRRQTDSGPSGTITVAIPLEQISQLWQELHWILEQLGTILEAEGLLPNAPSAPDSFSIVPNLLAVTAKSVPFSSPTVDAGKPLTTGPALLTTTSLPHSFSSPRLTTSSQEDIRKTSGEAAEPVPLMTSTGRFAIIASGSAPEATSSIPESLSTPMPSSDREVVVGTPESPTACSPAVGEDGTIMSGLRTPGASPTTMVSLEMNAPACYPTVTLEETITVQPVADLTTKNVDAECTTEATMAKVDDTWASAATPTITSGIATLSGGVFVATSVRSEPPKNTSTSSHTFDSQSTQNIAVYFGQTPVTGMTTLEAQCADPNVDIVILAFVINSNYQGKYPTVNFGAACGGQTSAMIADAPGLLSCTELEGYIEACQQTHGKKILLSLGGAASSLTFESASQASDFAEVLWQLFGPPGSIDPELRPFGNVSIDGFDVDNENNHPENYEILASTLRTKFDSDASKTYYLSSAPQCPFPDASNPLKMLLLCDFVFVQFYNNAPCEIGSKNFHDSIQQWSAALEESTISPKPRLYLGAPAWSAAGPSAYAKIGSPREMQGVVKEVKDIGLLNFGGVMFWDGPEGTLNTEGGKDILAWAKAGLIE